MMGYWEHSKYSKEQINKAGISRNLDIINEFRYDHEEISKEFLAIFEFEPIVLFSSRRLKRTPSIIKKIERSQNNHNTTRLSCMQDVGGCRFVFENINDIKHFMQIMKKKLSSFHEYKVHNYIDRKNNPKGPKPDGYRGIHIIYKYIGDKEEYQNLFLEVQLRTKLQHYRATALEIIDLMQESKIKEGDGEQIFKDFFKWTSIVLENLEGYKTPNKKKAIKNLKDILQQKDILEILNKRVVSYGLLYDLGVKKINITGDMILEITKESNSKINITPHYNKTVEELKSIYLKLEKQYETNSMKDIVYLSSEEIENAYPNYTGSAEQFISILKTELKIK